MSSFFNAQIIFLWQYEKSASVFLKYNYNNEAFFVTQQHSTIIKMWNVRIVCLKQNYFIGDKWMVKYIFWDLDGTLTDSSEGIIKCAQLALSHFGIENIPMNELKKFIGPPLRESFPKYGVPAENVEEAVKIYRGRYNTVGKFENKPYQGIDSLLKRLQDEGYKNFVATSKPEHLAEDILCKFHLDQYFEIICGATEDGRIDSKESVINYLLSKIDGSESAIMIGDTEFDVIGAKAHNIPTIVVDWGFGDEKEMLEAGAVGIAHSMDELHDMIINY